MGWLIFKQKKTTNFQKHLGISKNSGTPKWMVKIRENPIKHGMIWGGTPIFGSTPICFWSLRKKSAPFHLFRPHPHPSNTAPKLAQSRGICRRHISDNKEMPCLGGWMFSPNLERNATHDQNLKHLKKKHHPIYLKRNNIQPKNKGLSLN